MNLEDVIAPTDVRFLMTLPLERGRFFAAVRDPRRHFVPQICPWWSKYCDEIVAPFLALEAEATRLGCYVWRDVDLEKLARGFNEAFKVVVVFAHWSGNRVELAEGLVSVHDLVPCLPREFRGICDLTVCHPWALVSALKMRWPECTVKHAVGDVKSLLWWAVYQSVVRRLASRPEPWVDALLAVAGRFAAD